MGILDSFEMAPPEGQAGCSGLCSAHSPVHRVVPPFFCESPGPLSNTCDGAATWAFDMCLQNGGAGELGRAQEVSPSCLLEFGI